MSKKSFANVFFYLIIYYFSFFYVIDIFNIGNSILFSTVKEVMVVVLVLLLAYSSRVLFDKKLFFLLLCYSIILLVATIRARSLSYIFIDLKYYLIWPLMIYATKTMIRTTEDFRNFVKHVNIISLIIGVIGLIGYVQQSPFLTVKRTLFQTYAPKSILSTAFDFGACMAIAAICNMVSFQGDTHKVRKFSLIVFYSVMVFLSYTRGSILTLSIAAYILLKQSILRYYRRNRWRFVWAFFGDLLMVLGSVIFITTYSGDSLMLSHASLLDRITNVWPSMQINSLYTGAGFGTVGRSVNGIATYAVSDNSYLRIILTMGLIGLIAILGILKNIYDHAVNKEMLSMLFISVGVTAFFSDYIVFTPAAIIFYCLVGICMNIQNRALVSR